jgi:hypothetical protein
MARLKARGRTELARVSKEKDVPEHKDVCNSCNSTGKYLKDLSNTDGSYVFAHAGDPCASCDGSGKEKTLCSWERHTITLMSDRTMLEKRDVIFRSDNRPHTWGWKVKAKAKAGVTAEQFIAAYAKAGYTQEKTRV